MSEVPGRDATLRAARVEDAPAIAALINAAFRVERFFIDGDRTDTDEVRGLLEKGSFLLASDAAGGLAGCVYVELRGERAYFGLLSVDPARQRSGLGRRLVAAAEAHGRNAGCRHMDLQVVNLRAELPPFYRSLGYAESGRAPFPEDVPTKLACHFIRMSRAL